VLHTNSLPNTMHPFTLPTYRHGSTFNDLQTCPHTILPVTPIHNPHSTFDPFLALASNTAHGQCSPRINKSIKPSMACGRIFLTDASMLAAKMITTTLTSMHPATGSPLKNLYQYNSKSALMPLHPHYDDHFDKRNPPQIFYPISALATRTTIQYATCCLSH